MMVCQYQQQYTELEAGQSPTIKLQFGTMRVVKDTREMKIEIMFPATLNDAEYKGKQGHHFPLFQARAPIGPREAEAKNSFSGFSFL